MGLPGDRRNCALAWVRLFDRESGGKDSIPWERSVTRPGRGFREAVRGSAFRLPGVPT